MPTTDGRRTAILIPIIHSAADMGSLARQVAVDPARDRRVRLQWAGIQHGVKSLDLSWPAVMLYQDGLADAAPEIVRKVLAEVQSANYDLLRWLVAAGAVLVGTESPTLLTEEYTYLRAIADARDGIPRMRARKVYAGRAATLLAERDAYISRRIDATLPQAAPAWCFSGRSHQLARLLPPDLNIRTLPQGPVGGALDGGTK